jgi:hypothetical protein
MILFQQDYEIIIEKEPNWIFQFFEKLLSEVMMPRRNLLAELIFQILDKLFHEMTIPQRNLIENLKLS